MADQPPPPTTPPFALGSTFGAVYMSSLIVVAFWATAAVQVFTYFWRYPKDSISLKLFVGCMGMLTTAQVYMVVYSNWVVLIDNFGNYAGIANVSAPSIVQFLVQILVTLGVQGFFVFRIVKLTQKTWIIIVPWVLLALAQFVGCLMWAVAGLKEPTAASLRRPIAEVPGTLSLVATAVTDIVLSLILVILLLKHMGNSVYKPSLHMLRRLLILSINSGTWTAAFATIDVVTFWACPQNAVYTAFDYPACTLYLITLLANLNARRSGAREDPGDNYVEGGGLTISLSSTKRGQSSSKLSRMEFAKAFTSTTPKASTSDYHDDSRPETYV